jgi:predicted Zn-dependent protease
VTISRAEAKRLVHRILGHASFGDVRVRIRESVSGHTRFARSQPTTEGDIETLEIRVTAAKGGRHATVTGNRTDDAALAELVGQAESLAELAPVDPEHMPPLGRQSLLRVDAFDGQVAAMDAGDRIDLVGAAITAGKRDDLEMSGFLDHAQTATIVADRSGLFAHHLGTRLSLATTARTRDGTGSARRGHVSHRRSGLDARAVASDAARWAVRSASPRAIDPGRYTVVLMPDAVADIMSFFIGALDARRAAEGRSYFSAPGGGTRVGERLFDPSVRLSSDPSDRADPGSPFADDGRPHRKVDWVKDGKLETLVTSRYWADKTGATSVPMPDTFHMSGTAASLDELIAGVKRGILVTRFWYNRMLEPRTILATGLTRDGTFLVENGAIAHPVKNLRYNESPVTVLKRLVAAGKPERAGLSTGRVMVVPPVVVEGFHFGSISDAI